MPLAAWPCAGPPLLGGTQHGFVWWFGRRTGCAAAAPPCNSRHACWSCSIERQLGGGALAGAGACPSLWHVPRRTWGGVWGHMGASLGWATARGALRGWRCQGGSLHFWPALLPLLSSFAPHARAAVMLLLWFPRSMYKAIPARLMCLYPLMLRACSTKLLNSFKRWRDTELFSSLNTIDCRRNDEVVGTFSDEILRKAIINGRCGMEGQTRMHLRIRVQYVKTLREST